MVPENRSGFSHFPAVYVAFVLTLTGDQDLKEGRGRGGFEALEPTNFCRRFQSPIAFTIWHLDKHDDSRYMERYSSNCSVLESRAPFHETSDNVPSPKTVLCAQYSPVVIQFLLILKAKF